MKKLPFPISACKVVSVAILLAVFGSFGCRSTPETTPYHFSGFLDDYSGFRPADDGSNAWRYLRPGRDLRPYNKIMIDPLVIWHSPESEYKGVSSLDMWQLGLTFHQKMVEALDGGYTVVNQPGSGVLRLRAALTDVVAGRPELGSPGPLLPLANDILLQTTEKITSTNLFVGQAAIEGELLDSQTNVRLAGYIEKRQSSKTYASRKETSVGPIIEIFDYWAKKLRRRLDEERGVGKF